MSAQKPWESDVEEGVRVLITVLLEGREAGFVVKDDLPRLFWSLRTAGIQPFATVKEPSGRPVQLKRALGRALDTFLPTDTDQLSEQGLPGGDERELIGRLLDGQFAPRSSKNYARSLTAPRDDGTWTKEDIKQVRDKTIPTIVALVLNSDRLTVAHPDLPPSIEMRPLSPEQRLTWQRHREIVAGEDLARRLSNTPAVLRPTVSCRVAGAWLEDEVLDGATLATHWSDGAEVTLVTGDGGSGKTTTCLMLLDAVMKQHSHPDGAPLLGSRVAVAGWTPAWGDLAHWIAVETSRRTHIEKHYYLAALGTGHLVVVLDQVDELGERHLKEFDRQLAKLRAELPRLRAIVSCRTSTLERLPALAADTASTRMHLHPLSRDDVGAYLRAAGLLLPGENLTEEQWKVVGRELERPVRLAAAAVAFRGRRLDDVLELLSNAEFWQAYFTHQLDGPLPRGYDSTTVHRWLSWLTRHTVRGAPFWPSDGRLRPTSSGLLKWLAGPLAALVGIVTLVRPDLSNLHAQTAVSAALLATCPLLAMYSIGDGRMRYLRFSRHTILQGAGWGLLAAGALTLAGAAVLPLGTVIPAAVLLGAVIAGRWATAVQFDSQARNYVARGPEDLVRKALLSGAVFGPLYGLAFATLLSPHLGWTTALGWALPWLMIGGQGGALHYYLWKLEERALRGGPPVHSFLSFLSWADARSLLHRHGPGYEFLHVETWDYFRSGPDSPSDDYESDSARAPVRSPWRMDLSAEHRVVIMPAP